MFFVVIHLDASRQTDPNAQSSSSLRTGTKDPCGGRNDKKFRIMRKLGTSLERVVRHGTKGKRKKSRQRRHPEVGAHANRIPKAMKVLADGPGRVFGSSGQEEFSKWRQQRKFSEKDDVQVETSQYDMCTFEQHHNSVLVRFDNQSCA